MCVCVCVCVAAWQLISERRDPARTLLMVFIVWPRPDLAASLPISERPDLSEDSVNCLATPLIGWIPAN